jgi:uncharacterized protein YozE (UPF0346 family)
MAITFQEWLLQQQSRTDQVGMLARAISVADLSYTSSRRKDDEHKKWVEIIIRQGHPEQIQAFNEAWHEYLATKDHLT